MLLEEGLVWLPGAPQSWTEGDMLNVTKNPDGSYTVHNMGPMMYPIDKGTLIIWTPIPLTNAVFR